MNTGDIDVFCGNSNKQHMQNKHPSDYANYQSEIANIVNNADYIGYDQNDGSIELVKYFQTTGDYVKIAVRESANGVYFARSLYTLNIQRAQRFIANGTLQAC
ncbi:MAG: hypothetical protein IJU33_02050 [Bacteroidales bacterium]|nr:hypothetical protein [Bacteroidales bacterium]